jgi:hypothetical protein
VVFALLHGRTRPSDTMPTSSSQETLALG